jgi:predicted DCC family thiol-disulfide oxidoreductase YuxK
MRPVAALSRWLLWSVSRADIVERTAYGCADGIAYAACTTHCSSSAAVSHVRLSLSFRALLGAGTLQGYGMQQWEIPQVIQQVELEQQQEQYLRLLQLQQQQQQAALGGVGQAAAAGVHGASVQQLSFEEQRRLLANARTSVSACVQLLSLHLSLARLRALPCRPRDFCHSFRFRFTSLPKR